MQPERGYDDYVNFGSKCAGGLHVLSNFHDAPFTLQRADLTEDMKNVCPHINTWLSNNPVTFPTSEHLWQALKALDLPTFLRFTTTGDLGFWNVAVFAKTTAEEKAKKAKSEANKGKEKEKVKPRGRQPKVTVTFEEVSKAALKTMKGWEAKNNLGIVAKLAANEKYSSALGLQGHMEYDREHLTPAVERSVWLTILTLKFRAHPALVRVLTDTHPHRLVEFEKGARRLFNKGVLTHWNGLVDGGLLYGENVMGKYMEAMREAVMSKLWFTKSKLTSFATKTIYFEDV